MSKTPFYRSPKLGHKGRVQEVCGIRRRKEYEHIDLPFRAVHDIRKACDDFLERNGLNTKSAGYAVIDPYESRR